MAFKSYDELIDMASRNPKKATEFVKRAQQTDKPVVSTDNPGYQQEDPRQKALKRSMKRQQNSTVVQRKEMEY